MVVVTNTSPLNYLVLIGCDHLLPALFGGVLVPETVFKELDSDHAPPLIRQWVNRWPSWAEVRPATSLPADLQSLDGGEAAAIALALTTDAHLVLLDERKGRRVAREHNLTIDMQGWRRTASTKALYDKLVNKRGPNTPNILIACVAGSADRKLGASAHERYAELMKSSPRTRLRSIELCIKKI